MFRQLCKMSQKDLKKFVAKALEATHESVHVGDGYVYAQGTFPVLLVAHLDTVHEHLPKTIMFNKQNGSLSSPQGIGGDDRCGVYMVLEVIKKYNCSVLFCEDEESGGIGATKFTKTKLAKNLGFNYIIEFDRQGRINITSPLVHYANIEKECVIIGVNERLEIWSKEEFDKYMEANEESLEEITEGLFDNLYEA